MSRKYTPAEFVVQLKQMMEVKDAFKNVRIRKGKIEAVLEPARMNARGTFIISVERID